MRHRVFAWVVPGGGRGWVCLSPHHTTRHGRARVGYSCGRHGAEATREVEWWDGQGREGGGVREAGNL